jgi:hypothetical protein
MTRIFRFVFAILSVGFLAAGYYYASLVWPAVGLLFFGMLWLTGLVFNWDWVLPIGLYVAFGVAAIGLFLSLSPLILVSSAIFALLAWDLGEFHLRLCKASAEDDISRLEHPHLVRILLIALAGGALTALSLTLRFNLSFEWLVILMFFAVWGIGRMVNWLLKKES